MLAGGDGEVPTCFVMTLWYVDVKKEWMESSMQCVFIYSIHQLNNIVGSSFHAVEH